MGKWGAVLAIAGTLLLGSNLPAQEGYKIIVNPDNPVTSVSGDFLRKAFLRKATEWTDGSAIRPVDLSAKTPVRTRFTKEVLKKTPSQLKSFWNQQIFSGKADLPCRARLRREQPHDSQ